jgi:hypothetical protein
MSGPICWASSIDDSKTRYAVLSIHTDENPELDFAIVFKEGIFTRMYLNTLVLKQWD